MAKRKKFEVLSKMRGEMKDDVGEVCVRVTLTNPDSKHKGLNAKTGNIVRYIRIANAKVSEVADAVTEYLIGEQK